VADERAESTGFFLSRSQVHGHTALRSNSSLPHYGRQSVNNLNSASAGFVQAGWKCPGSSSERCLDYLRINRSNHDLLD